MSPCSFTSTAGGAKCCQDQLVRERLEAGLRFRRLQRLGSVRQGRGERAGKSIGSGPLRGLQPLENPQLVVQRREQVGERADGFRAAEKQHAAGIQAVVKQRHELLLHLGRQVDQQIAAAQEIQLGEGRIHDEALRGKDDQLADLAGHPAAVLILDEEPAHALGRDIRGNVFRIDARPGLVDRVLVQVGGENLQRDFLPGLSFSSTSLNTMARE